MAQASGLLGQRLPERSLVRRGVIPDELEELVGLEEPLLVEQLHRHVERLDDRTDRRLR